MSDKTAIVVGAGYTGLAAAYDLAKAGWRVRIFEEETFAGGLAGTFEVAPGRRLERFYHHWFSSDQHIIGWLRELGLGDAVGFSSTETSLFHANQRFRLASPFDLLTFTPIPILDRLRTGIMALKARSITKWQSLEDETAADWILRNGGRRAFEVIWKPLLQGKFGAEAGNVSAVWFWNKLKLRGASRDSRGEEVLAYFRGGFGAATEKIVEALQGLGVDFEFEAAVDEIVSSRNRVLGVLVKDKLVQADVVLATLPLPRFLHISKGLPSEYVELHSRIRFLGNVCLVLRLSRSLSSTYWLNVADPSFPYVGIIEHTNLDGPENYGGSHIAYLSKYLPVTDPMYSMSRDDLVSFSVPYIKQMFPEFSRDWIEAAYVWRAEYSQPVITRRYSELLPDAMTPIHGLWLSTMAQIYPEDRGTNYAVRHGRATAARIIAG